MGLKKRSFGLKRLDKQLLLGLKPCMRTYHGRACTDSEQRVGHEVLSEACRCLMYCSIFASPRAALSGLICQAARGNKQTLLLTIDTKLVIHCISGLLFLTASQTFHTEAASELSSMSAEGTNKPQVVRVY